MKKLLMFLLAALLTVSLFVSCGSEDTTSSAGSSSAPPNTSAPSGSDPEQTTLPSQSTEDSTVTAPNVDVTGDLLYPVFENPAADMTTKPLWFWNTDLDSMTTDMVREIVRESYLQSGYSGFGILPYWQNGYLSDRYFELYEAALDEGAKYGMHFSLYDEDGFPSYTAGGLFAEAYPDLTAKRLDMVESSRVKNGKIFLKIPQGTFMGALLWNTATGERIDVSDRAHLVVLPEFVTSQAPLGISASSTYDISAGYEIDKAFDGKKNTRWNAYQHSGAGEYILINYGKPTGVDQVKLYETVDKETQRIQKVLFQYWDEEALAWVTLAEAGAITDKGVDMTFDKVEKQYYRIYFKAVNGDSVSITEAEILCGGKAVANPGFAKPDAPQQPQGLTFISSGDFSAGYAASMAFDGDMNSRWNSTQGVAGGSFVGVRFDEPQTVDTVILSEALNRIRSFRIESYDGSAWVKVAEGTTIGSEKTISFAPVVSRGIRLSVVSTNGNEASIYEMSVYGGDRCLTLAEETDSYEGSYLDVAVTGEGWKAMAFVCVSEGCIGMDYLSEEAVKGFIDITYEAYYKRFKKYFDNGTITSAFFDEPSFWPAGGLTAYGVQGARMWTDDFNQVFAEMFGKDINPVLYYPALWYDIGEDTVEARDRLMAVRTEMFADHYLGQVSRWCDDHGIRLMGHMLFEDQDNPVPLHGDLMYAFKYQSIPSVDVIDRYDMTGKYYKIISSSAYNWDKDLVASETYGAMGANLPVSSLYKCAMDLYAKGINLIVPHAVWYDGVNNVVYPPELSYRNSKYAAELPVYNRYVARLATMLQTGRHVADIAVLYPIDTLEYEYNFNRGFEAAAGSNYIALTDRLSTVLRYDFTYLHPSVLDEKVSVQGTELHLANEVNYEDYKVMVLPSIRVISLSNLQKILAFYHAGGKVISVGNLPTMATKAEDTAEVVRLLTELFGESPATVSGKNKTVTGEKGGSFTHVTKITEMDSALDQAVEHFDVSISKTRETGGHLTYIHKVVKGSNVWFFANSNEAAVNPTVTLRGEYKALEVWDPMTGSRTALEATVENGVTTFQLPLAKVTSLFVVEAGTQTPAQ